MLRFVAGTALALLLCALSPAQAEYRLQDLDGNEHRLSALRGEWVMINFWATWCPPCIHEMPELEAFHQAHKGGKASVWGVTFEDASAQAIREFVSELGVTYPILGLGQSPVTPFGTVRVLPTTFVINPAGELVRRFEGPVTAAKLEAVMRETPAAPQQVLQTD